MYYWCSQFIFNLLFDLNYCLITSFLNSWRGKTLNTTVLSSVPNMPRYCILSKTNYWFIRFKKLLVLPCHYVSLINTSIPTTRNYFGQVIVLLADLPYAIHMKIVELSYYREIFALTHSLNYLLLTNIPKTHKPIRTSSVNN